MALEIKSTPVLTGEDAERFIGSPDKPGGIKHIAL